MRLSYWLCALAALLFCTVAWLLSLLLADHLFVDESMLDDPDIVLTEIEGELNTNPADAALIEQLEYDFNVEIKISDNSQDSESTDYDISDDYIAYDIALLDGRDAVVAFPLEGGFFSHREWLHLAFQCLAALASVCTSILIMNSRLKLLEGATRDAHIPDLQNQSSDPIEKAVLALNYAKQNILQLSESKKSAAMDYRDLLASVAHEFRNPLARLQFANEMAMERTGSEQKALFEEANTAAVELDELVRETLRYSRISSMDSALSIEQLSVEDIFRDIANSATTNHEHIALRIQYPDQEFTIRADQRLFTRALVNLVDNGFRYAKSTVTLGVEAVSGACLFTVKDDGDGIAAIHHDKLFEPFYRVEPSRSRDTGGFGLGLSIVKSVCDRHDASVSVNSDTNGTCFTIRFPASPSHANAE